MLTTKQREIIREYHALGWSQRDIAEKAGCTQTTVKRWQQQNSLAPHGYSIRAKAKMRHAYYQVCESLGITKLASLSPKSQKQEIRPEVAAIVRRMTNEGHSQRSIGDKLRVHQSTIGEWQAKLGIAPAGNTSERSRAIMREIKKKWLRQNGFSSLAELASARNRAKLIADQALAPF